jgi:hypothetical protein
MKPQALTSPAHTVTVQHQSDEVYCHARQEPAVISVIERTDAHGAMRFVLWCSLRAIGACDERCLRRR